jgi:quercetin dioxygenase-like cupin family protein
VTLRALAALAAVAVLLPALAAAGAAEEPASPHFRDADAVSWKTNDFAVARWKTLVGGDEGGQLDDPDVRFGLWELAPRAVYHGHRHAAPELYHVLSGRARWTVDGEVREVGPGTTIRTPSGAVHRMENLGDETLRAVWFWWAPDGRREVFDGVYEFTEPPPADPGPGFAAPGRSRSPDDGTLAPADAAFAVLDAFMAAFNARDLEAWEATYHFPHFRMADGALTILPAAGERSPALFDALAATGWHHSAWLSREVVQAGPDKVHVAVEFARYRADGSELARYASLYVVTREGGRWGIRGRSSFAP